MPAERAPDGVNRAAITVCVILATLMQALDTTIANVALPYMQGSLSASQDQINWVLTSYIVAAAIMTAPVGWIANRFGRKRIFIVCSAGFTIASVMCGLAQDINQMVLFRLLQGVFGAALVPEIEAAGQVVARRDLLTHVWRLPYGGADKTVDVHVSWLRRKLGETAQHPRYLHTVRGVGIKLSPPA